MTGAHIGGSPATVEDAQTPVMNLYEERTAQLGGPSGTAVAVPEDAIAWNTHSEGIRRARRVRASRLSGAPARLLAPGVW